jgi:hypothetical protein
LSLPCAANLFQNQMARIAIELRVREAQLA